MLAPGSQSSLREANALRILEAVRTFGGITQVELAAATGLSPATVSNIVKQLERDGIVATSATTRSGRRAQQVSLVPSSGLSLGVHITPRSLDLYLADASHDVQLARRLPLPEGHRHDTTLDRVALLVGEASDDVGASMDDVVSIGVALPQAMTARASAASLTGWEDVDIVKTLQRRLGRPVALSFSADAAAVAESRYGALRGSGTSLYVRVGDTVEASILFDGRPHTGAFGPAGAIGHVQVDPAGRICRCGARGCLDTVVSVDALADLLRLSHGPMTMRQIVSGAKRGDAGCRQVLADTGAAIGPVIANSATVLGPARIMVGGELASTGEVFLSPIRDALRARPLLSGDDLLVDGESLEHAEAMGASALALDQLELPLSPGKGL